MSDYQHILLASDFSDHCKEVALKARELAQCHQAELSLVHVIDNVPLIDIGYETVLPFDNDMSELLMNAAKDRMDQWIAELDLSCKHQWLEFGSPRDEITRLAAENGVDLIVLGSHGRHGLRLLLGSTANAVLHYAPCDVLAVRLKDD